MKRPLVCVFVHQHGCVDIGNDESTHGSISRSHQFISQSVGSGGNPRQACAGPCALLCKLASTYISSSLNHAQVRFYHTRRPKFFHNLYSVNALHVRSECSCGPAIDAVTSSPIRSSSCVQSTATFDLLHLHPLQQRLHVYARWERMDAVLRPPPASTSYHTSGPTAQHVLATTALSLFSPITPLIRHPKLARLTESFRGQSRC